MIGRVGKEKPKGLRALLSWETIKQRKHNGNGSGAHGQQSEQMTQKKPFQQEERRNISARASHIRKTHAKTRIIDTWCIREPLPTSSAQTGDTICDNHHDFHNDHSSSQLSVHKALTCLEDQSALVWRRNPLRAEIIHLGIPAQTCVPLVTQSCAGLQSAPFALRCYLKNQRNQIRRVSTYYAPCYPKWSKRIRPHCESTKNYHGHDFTADALAGSKLHKTPCHDRTAHSFLHCALVFPDTSEFHFALDSHAHAPVCMPMS